MADYEGNSWIGINQDMPSDKRDENSTYLHLTKNKDEAIVVDVVGYRDIRMKTVELYSQWIKREQKEQSKIMRISQILS